MTKNRADFTTLKTDVRKMLPILVSLKLKLLQISVCVCTAMLRKVRKGDGTEMDLETLCEKLHPVQLRLYFSWAGLQGFSGYLVPSGV